MFDFILKNYPEEICRFLKETFAIQEQRGKVGDDNGIYFIIHTNDHNPPHLHAKYGEYEAKINIENGQIISSNLPKAKRKYASQWTIKNKLRLMEKWNEIFIDEKLPYTGTSLY